MIINLTKTKNNINENISYKLKCYNKQKQEIKELENNIKDMSIKILESQSEKLFKSNLIKKNQELQ